MACNRDYWGVSKSAEKLLFSSVYHLTNGKKKVALAKWQISYNHSIKELYPRCGLRMSTRNLQTGLKNESKIYGGGDASSGQYPWMVMVQIYDGSTNTNSFCGGSLISSRWIVTTAFCVDGAQSTITDFKSFARSANFMSHLELNSDLSHNI